MTFWTCLVARSESGTNSSWPAAVRTFNTKVASGLEFSEATTTAPVHPTMPGIPAMFVRYLFYIEAEFSTSPVPYLDTTAFDV
jgi:hypothetical protein